jgi:erythromycin esterase-like protein
MKKNMSPARSPGTVYNIPDDWVRRDAIPFSPDTPESVNAALDRLLASSGDQVKILGFGEALHGSRDILLLRNQIFRHLVEAQGCRAIAIESSFPRSRVVNEYVAGRGPASYDELQDSGFSYGFRRLEGNRELVEWMREYNADPAHQAKLRFYGFDSPTEMMKTDSPRQLLEFALGYLSSADPATGREYRERIGPLIGEDADWENTAAAMDPAQSVGLSPAATALRIETEELITELHVRRPGLVVASDEDRYREAVHSATAARQLLTYHAGVARKSGQRVARLLGMRDAMMADNLAYIMDCEKDRGKVFAFAHNSHLKHGRTKWQPGNVLNAWWPVGTHLKTRLGAGYAVIGSGAGVSEAHGIGQPEPGSLEAQLMAAAGPARIIPTHGGRGLPASVENLPVRSGSPKNPTYFPFTPQSLTDFDWLLVLDSLE